MNDIEWAGQCLKESAVDLAKGLAIYAVLVGAYWLLVG